MVLSLTLGGVSPVSFLAGLFLRWLYCMALALVTLWLSLYFNDLIAAGVTVSGATILALLGCAPLPVQPFVLTPFPALVHPVYASMTMGAGQSTHSFVEIFLWCAVSMSVTSCVALVGISRGPLYGIVRENSTFGEVIRKGDSRRKRRFRMRPHIQRPSEIAFFYENRGQRFRRYEGLIRWGTGLGVLLFGSGAITWVFTWDFGARLPQMNLNGSMWRVYEFHTIYLIIHGFGVALAILFFSHSKNCTGLRLPLIAGKAVEVARLDTLAFVLFLLFSTAVSIATPFYIDQVYASVAGGTIFLSRMQGTDRPQIDFLRVAIEGSLVISVAGLVIYAFQRLMCLMTWVKSGTLALVGILYFVGICLVPLFFAVLAMDFPQFRDDPMIQLVGPRLAMASPFMVMMRLFNEAGGRFPDDVSTASFYVAHGILFLAALGGIRRNSRRLSQEYLPPLAEEGRP